MGDLFFELLRVSLNRQDHLSRTPSSTEWIQLYRQASKQTVLGICLLGIKRLPDQSKTLPEDIFNTWLAQTVQTAQLSGLQKSVIINISKLLDENRVDAIFMKGLICATRYPEPDIRQCGDIDFVVGSDDYRKTIQLLERIGTVNHELIHEHHGLAYVNGVTVEPHFKIHNYQNPKNDRTMLSLKDDVFKAVPEYVIIENTKIRKFPQEFEGMYLVSHMVNHVFEEGLGLRQVLDYYYWLQDFNGGKDVFFSYLDKMRMRRAARIFGLITEMYLGMECGKGCMEPATKKERLFAKKMMEDIMRVGNFGREYYHGTINGLKDELKNYLWVLKRSFSLAYLCPQEAYWWPFGKLVRYINKRL